MLTEGGNVMWFEGMDYIDKDKKNDGTINKINSDNKNKDSNKD